MILPNIRPEELDAALRGSPPPDSFSSRPLGVSGERNEFAIVPITEIGPAAEPDWLWPGYVARGCITLFTGLWKAGKTTLLGHLLRNLFTGGGLVPVPITDPVLVLSEEPPGIWSARRDALGLPESVLMLKRSTFTRPSLPAWVGLVDALSREVESRGIALVLIDTLPSFWPVTNENDASEVMNALTPLRALSEAGAAVLLVHHPRKCEATEGRGTRGSGALPGFVDVILELRRHNPDDSADRRRVLRAYGRFESTPPEAVVELTAAGYVTLGERAKVAAADDLRAIAELLPTEGHGMTWEEVREAWPTTPKPGQTRLRGLLEQGRRDDRWTRSGMGNRGDPWRYRQKAGGSDSLRSPDTQGGRNETNPGGGGTWMDNVP